MERIDSAISGRTLRHFLTRARNRATQARDALPYGDSWASELRPASRKILALALIDMLTAYHMSWGTHRDLADHLRGLIKFEVDPPNNPEDDVVMPCDD